MEVTNCAAPEVANTAVIENGVNRDEILNFAVLNGIIDLPHLQAQVEMKKNEDILKKHPYSIWEGKNQKWYTYLPDGDGRKLVKRSTEEAIKKAIIQYYKENADRPKTFMEAYRHWRSVQDTMVCNNTTKKYDTDCKRYFEGTEFAEMEIEDITEEHIKVFIVQTIKEKKLCKKACKTLFGYIKNTIYSARVNKYITENPMEFLQANNFYKYCTEKEKPVEQKVFSKDDIGILQERFEKDNTDKPEYIPTYAVRLAYLTGMRVGEISALSWSDIKDTYIVINKSEKYDRITKEYFIDKTKNKKDRVFPLTHEISKLLENLHEVEEKNGYLCEWVFANETGRIHAPIISSCIKNKCHQEGITERGIHSFRKTINSKLRCNGVSSTVAASLLGHTKEVNEQYYTFDVTDLDYKTEIVEKIEQS